MRFFLLIFAWIFCTACTPFQLKNPSHQHSSDFASSFSPSRKADILPPTKEGQGGSYKPFPMDNNASVDWWMNYYSKGKGRKHMKIYLERSTRYLDLMQSILEYEGLPSDLVYMAMAESGFYPYAKSTKNAIGYWQFIYPTGRNYGLKIDNYVDERRDFVLSTQAAVRYLVYLYKDFGDWRLSMAAYNSGEANVRAAIKKHNSYNYWYLVRVKALPSETRNYVPKIIAMRKIALEPEKYGFYNLNYYPSLDYHVVPVSGSTTLSHLSRSLNIPLKELKGLNPKFRTDYIPVGGQEIRIRVPIYIANI